MELPFIIFKKKLDQDWILSYALKLNNLLVIPMKISEIVETKNSDGHYLYNVKVENCADKKEWALLVSSFLMGSNAQAELDRKAICQPIK